jgi:hypothetical protein
MTRWALDTFLTLDLSHLFCICRQTLKPTLKPTMKLSILFLIPLAATAFAPVARPSASRIKLFNEVDDACETVTSTTEDIVKKVDSLALTRVMRFVDHAPMLLTLKCLADKAGMSIARSGITAGSGAFGGLATALPVSSWAFNIYAVAAVAQLASIAKSSLAENSNELSQGTITATAATNFMVTRAIGSANPLRDTALVALVSAHSLRTNGGDGAVTVHNAAVQLVSSFTTVLTVLGVVSAIAGKISFINAGVTSILGLASYYIMATRAGNGTVKKAVNAGIIGGVVYSRIAAGIKISLDLSSVVAAATTIGAAYVAYGAIDRLRKAVMD